MPHLTEVKENSATIAEFGYDGDGQMVSASIGGVTTSYVGGYFEWQTSASGSAAVKRCSAGSARIAMRKAGMVTYLFGGDLDFRKNLAYLEQNPYNRTRNLF